MEWTRRMERGDWTGGGGGGWKEETSSISDQD